MRKYKCEEMQWLQGRWSRDLVNSIVVALNQGTPVLPLLGTVEQADKIAPLPGRMDFRGIDFSHQNLRGPWTTEEDKRFRGGVNLRGADFTGADLSWAILPNADLQGSIFIDSNLSFAELILSDLSGADLTDADMTGAWLLDTKFYDALVTEEQLNSRQNHGQMDFDYHAFEI